MFGGKAHRICLPVPASPPSKRRHFHAEIILLNVRVSESLLPGTLAVWAKEADRAAMVWEVKEKRDRWYKKC